MSHSEVLNMAFSLTFKCITVEALRYKLAKTVKSDKHLSTSVTQVIFRVYSTPIEGWLAFAWGSGRDEVYSTTVEALGLKRLDDIVIPVKANLTLVKGGSHE